MDDDLDYNINEPETLNLKSSKEKCSKKLIIIINVIISLVIITALVLIYFFVLKNSGDEKKESKEKKYYYFLNVSTAVNGKIPNSFKENGSNYNDSIGNLNNGEDFEPNDRNNFDFCFTDYHLRRKNKTNILYLQFHGGGWVAQNKENITIFCEINEAYNAMTATMSYTLLNNTYPQSSIYRIMDDATATLNGIKKILKAYDFNLDKIELGVHGSSAGGHLALLYAYLIKNSPFPIKFIFDNMGLVSISPYDFLISKNVNDSLNSIEPKSIKEANNTHIITILNGQCERCQSQIILIQWMNLFLGRNLDEDFDEMYDSEKHEIIYGSPKFNELLSNVTYAFPSSHVTKDSPAVLCKYDGMDLGIGIAQYAKLKQAYIDKTIEDKIELVYFRYSNHGDGNDKDIPNSELWDKKRKEMIKKYFTQDD